jgi:hypothetical protein
VLIHKEIRYLSVLVLPGALVLATAIRYAWRRRPVFGYAAVLVCALSIGFGFRHVGRAVVALRANMTKFQSVALAIQQHDPIGVAFPHFRWPMRVNFFTGFSDGFREFAPARPGARFRVPAAHDVPLPGEWVVIDPGYFGPGGEWWLAHDPLPSWIEEPPGEWPRVLAVGRMEVLTVPGESGELPDPEARIEEERPSQ